MKKIGKYILNILISLDQLGNSILLGDPDETISSRIGRIKRKWGGRIPWGRPITKLVDCVIERVDPGHSLRVIENDEGKNGLVDRPVIGVESYKPGMSAIIPLERP